MNKSISSVGSCSDCLFFFGNPGDLNKTGQCRRFPPKMLSISQPGYQVQVIPVFSAVQHDLWCGEFDLKVKPTVSN